MKILQRATWRRGPLLGLLAGLVVGLLAMGRGAAAAILEQNPWDNLTRPGWSYDSGSHVIDATSGTPNSPNALRFTFPAGMVDGVGPGIAEYGFPSTEEIYYGYWFKFSDNFEWHPVTTKMSFIWFTQDAVAPNTLHDAISAGGFCTAGDCGPLKFIIRTGDPGPTGDAVYGHNQAYNPTIQTNRWYWVEVRARMNTPGVKDGLLEAWLDDQLIMRHTNVHYRAAGQSSRFVIFMHSATYGGNGGTTKTRTDYLWFDQTTLATTRIGMPGSPSPSCTSDPGTAFCEDFEDGNVTGWSLGGTSGRISVASTGLNGTSRSVELVALTDEDPLLSSSYSLPLGAGQTFWAEWWERYDPSFVWGYGCCNESYKSFDLRNDGVSGGRMLFDYHLGSTRFYFMADPEANPPQNGNFFFEPNIDPSFRLQPGQTYHFVLQITNERDPNGSFKVWINDRLTYDYTGVGTCGNASGACTWGAILLGGPQQLAAASGNKRWYDQIRITRTNIAPPAGCLRGDLDCNGKVDLDDLRRMIYMLVGTVPQDLTKADLDGDGQLLLVDLQLLVKILVGIP